jgi:hypothetical protein
MENVVCYLPELYHCSFLVNRLLAYKKTYSGYEL